MRRLIPWCHLERPKFFIRSLSAFLARNRIAEGRMEDFGIKRRFLDLAVLVRRANKPLCLVIGISAVILLMVARLTLRIHL